MSVRRIVDDSDDEDWGHAYPRPRNNPDIIGHADAEAVLRVSWESGRMPHAWLITGPKGIGKATLAYRLARFVLSRSSDSAPQAGPSLFGADDLPADDTEEGLFVATEHPVAHRVARAAHADLMAVERTLNDKTKKLRTEIGVDGIRKVGGVLSLTPGEGTWRVVVVDTADELSVNAANALLKMLEEPPKRSLMLLTSAMPGRLLATIRSRCRRLDLGPVSNAAIEAALDRVAPDADAAERAAAVVLAAGSPGRALDLVEQGGLGVFSDLMTVLGALADGSPDLQATQKVVAAIGKAGADAQLEVFFDALQTAVHGASALASGRAEPADGTGWGHPRTLAVCRKLAGQGSLDSWLEVWDNLGRARAQLSGLNLDRRQVGQSLLWSIEQAARA